MTNFKKGIDLDSSSVSPLSRRLNGMNPDLFHILFLDLVGQIHAKTHYTKLIMPLKIIDSTTLPLNMTFLDYEKMESYGKFAILNYPRIQLFYQIKWF